jgi:hypothetical protein
MSVWKQGDTLPDMVIDCFDGVGAPANLSGASTVTVKVWKMGTLIWERDADNKPADGAVRLSLQASDTNVPGTYRVKVLAVWPDGSRQHYPPGDQYTTMTVTR